MLSGINCEVKDISGKQQGMLMAGHYMPTSRGFLPQETELNLLEKELPIKYNCMLLNAAITVLTFVFNHFKQVPLCFHKALQCNNNFVQSKTLLFTEHVSAFP